MTLRDVILGTLTFLLIVALGLALLAWLNRAPEPLLLVDAAIQESTEPAGPAWRLHTRCPVNQRNIPLIDDRRA